MGSVVSAIGGAIEAVIGAIASVFLAIVGGITWILVAIWEFLIDIICCRCGSRRRTGTSRTTASRRWRRSGRTSTY